MASQSAPPCIVWFRDDLRLSDHPALHAAAATGRPVICLYVFDETKPHGAGATAWRRGPLVVGAIAAGACKSASRPSARRWCCARVPRQGSSPRLARATGAGAVFWNEIAQAPHQAAADEVAAALKEIGVTTQSFPGDLLAAPADIRNKEGRGLRVFTPFWRRVQALGGPPRPLPAPDTLGPGPNLASDTARKLVP